MAVRGKLYRQRIWTVCFSIFICLLLPGCWDEVNLQEVSYISAIGIDYEEGQFTIYAQMIYFAAIAKSETPQAVPDPIWIGKGKGDSVLMAFYNLTKAGYTTLNLEHLKTVVIHERALSRISDVIDGLNRQRATRYTSLLYGTSMPLDKLFTTETFFNESPLISLLYAPRPHEIQHTFVMSQKMQTAVQQLKDPGMTTLLPALNTTEAYWKHGKKPMNSQIINGIYVFKNFTYQGYAAQQDVIGIRWLNKNFEKVYIEGEKGGGKATVSINNVSIRPRALLSGNNPKFELTVKLKGHVIEMDSEMSEEEITASIEQRVKEEIEATYQYGVEKKMDLFGLEHYLYRYHYSYWKEQTANGAWRLQKDGISVNVKLQIKDPGKLELGSST